MDGTPFTLKRKGDALPGPSAAAAELAVEIVRPSEVASADVVYPLPKWSDLK
jgi:hypothetical protein